MGLIALTIALIGVAAVLVLSTPPHVANAAPALNIAAAPAAKSVDKPANGPAAAPLPAPLQQTAIFTDTYDASQVNDQVGNASLIPIAACSAATPINSLTLYRAIPNPATDVDYYRISPLAQKVITVTVSVVNSNLQLRVTLIDNSGSNIIASNSGQNVTLTGYNLAAGSSLYIQVSAVDTSVTGTESKPYSLLVCQSDANVLPTATPTPTPTPTATPPGGVPDNREPNDTPSIAWNFNRANTFINIGSQLTGLNFYTTTDGVRERGDVDWFWFYSQGAKRLRVTTSVQPGVDTELFIYDGRNLPPDSPNPQMVNLSNQGLIAFNDDYQPLDRGSQIIFDTAYEGVYWIKVWNKDQSTRVAGQTYNLTLAEIAPLTSTVTPAPTAFPAGVDKFEPNNDFDHATLIAPGVKVDGLNFVPYQPPSADTPDYDYFRVPIKQGLYYTCETLDLSAGTDTTMVVFSAPNFNSVLGENDDISPDDTARGSFRSRVSWFSTYSGFAYILIGEPLAVLPKPFEAASRTYSLLCTIGLPATPTPTVNPTPPTATPLPATPTPVVPPTPVSTARVPINLVVQPVDSSAAQPTSAPSPTPRILVIEVQTFVDLNGNGQLDPGSKEGIAGTSVRLYDANTATPLGQAFTDGDGKVRFSINNDGPVQISVPVFGYLTTVNTSPAIIRISIPPFVQLPDRLP